jgi:hypothetical protein
MVVCPIESWLKKGMFNVNRGVEFYYLIYCDDLRTNWVELSYDE